jgi:hypothetical protein
MGKELRKDYFESLELKNISIEPELLKIFYNDYSILGKINSKAVMTKKKPSIDIIKEYIHENQKQIKILQLKLTNVKEILSPAIPHMEIDTTKDKNIQIVNTNWGKVVGFKITKKKNKLLITPIYNE